MVEMQPSAQSKSTCPVEVKATFESKSECMSSYIYITDVQNKRLKTNNKIPQTNIKVTNCNGSSHFDISNVMELIVIEN